MRRAAFSSIRLALVVLVLIVPACRDLPKVDVIRLIDDFARDAGAPDAGGTPTWGVFTPWTCDAFAMAPDGGPVDPGQPSGADGGPPVTCAVGNGEGFGVDRYALVTTFDLAASANTWGVAVATRASSSAVDFTAFKTFQFYGWLYSRTNEIPPGTQLKVELGCPASGVPFAASLFADNVTVAANWGNQVLLSLADFKVPPVQGPPTDGGQDNLSSESTTACLRAVDRISFIVTFNVWPNPIAGSLLLDGIELSTKPK
jgi:hypothetical protein